MRREGNNMKFLDRTCNKICAYALGENNPKVQAQNKAVKKVDGFLTSIVGIVLLVGSVAAFGFWALAVIGIILGFSLMTPKK